MRPVIFSPKNPQTSPLPGAAAAADPKSSGRFRNPAMEEALRDALGLPRASASAASVLIPAQPVQQDATAPRGAKAGSRKPKKATLLLAAVRTKAKTPKPRSDAAKIPRSLARQKKPKPSPPTAARPQVKDVAKPMPEWQRRAKESIAKSRCDLNARLRGATTVQATSPFLDLQRRWRHEFAYLQRFQFIDPEAPDIAAARARLAAIEAEWERRTSLAPDDPDYFPWPSTEAVGGDGSVVTGEWQEIGMLGYLGYHVGMTSSLNAAQRQSLLAHVFTMRLPPFNSVAYMASWAQPRTGPRLRKMAEAIAAFARNAKRRRNPKLAEAIRQWEDDLSYLYRTFYVGRFDGFSWPIV